MPKPAIEVLTSHEDRSVNFVFNNGVEARYVRRTEDYAIVYLSSHNGCNMACRFCHLTQTKQVEMRETSLSLFVEQAQAVITHYRNQVRQGLEQPVKRFNFNWMARGEPLANEKLLKDWAKMTAALEALAHIAGVYEVQFNFSTIMPYNNGLYRLMHHPIMPAIYYSLYSVDPKFRRRWLPKAQEPFRALLDLKYYQDKGGEVVLHWAFIEGENDSEKDMDDILQTLKTAGMQARFNLVRYNPYSEVQGQEPSEEVLQARFNQMNAAMGVPGSRIVPRVGRDVYASCGTFINLLAKELGEQPIKIVRA